MSDSIWVALSASARNLSIGFDSSILALGIG